MFLLDTGTPGTSREVTAKIPREKLELETRSGNKELFPVVGRYFLIIFLSARILEGEEILKKSTFPQDNYWKSPISLSVRSNLLAVVSPNEVVCCPYFSAQSQIIDDYGIMSFNSVICSPINSG